MTNEIDTMIIKLSDEQVYRTQNHNDLKKALLEESALRAENDSLIRVKLANESSDRAKKNSILSQRISIESLNRAKDTNKLKMELFYLENKIKKLEKELANDEKLNNPSQHYEPKLEPIVEPIVEQELEPIVEQELEPIVEQELELKVESIIEQELEPKENYDNFLYLNYFEFKDFGLEYFPRLTNKKISIDVLKYNLIQSIGQNFIFDYIFNSPSNILYDKNTNNIYYKKIDENENRQFIKLFTRDYKFKNFDNNFNQVSSLPEIIKRSTRIIYYEEGFFNELKTYTKPFISYFEINNKGKWIDKGRQTDNLIGFYLITTIYSSSNIL